MKFLEYRTMWPSLLALLNGVVADIGTGLPAELDSQVAQVQAFNMATFIARPA